jgi:hypothetical protein
MAPFNPALIQPCNIFFTLTLGGLTKTYVNSPSGPQIPIDFRFETTVSGMPTVYMTLFDETGFEAEPAFWDSIANPTADNGMMKGKFQFGYQGKTPYMSDEYTFFLTHFKPKESGNTHIIRMVGSVTSAAYMSSNPLNGTLDEVLQQFAKNENAQLNIDPPFGPHEMRDTGHTDKDSTDLVDPIFMKRKNESDWDFINRTLDHAVDAQGNGGYQIGFSQDPNSGQKIINITRPGVGTVLNTYIIQDPNTVVIQDGWDYDSVSGYQQVFRASGGEENGYQNPTGDPEKKVTDPIVTQNNQTQLPGQNYVPRWKSQPPHNENPDSTYYWGDFMPGSVMGSCVRSRPGAKGTPYGAKNKFINKAIKIQTANLTGTLSVLGDPKLDPSPFAGNAGKLIEIVDYYPINYRTGHTPQQLHWSSGYYFFQSATHIISAGSYITQLYLTRFGGPPPADNVDTLSGPDPAVTTTSAIVLPPGG